MNLDKFVEPAVLFAITVQIGLLKAVIKEEETKSNRYYISRVLGIPIDDVLCPPDETIVIHETDLVSISQVRAYINRQTLTFIVKKERQ